MDPMVIRAAATAAVDRHFLAYYLGGDLHAAAARLGITQEDAAHLYLCRTPKCPRDLQAIVAKGWVSEVQLKAELGDIIHSWE